MLPTSVRTQLSQLHDLGQHSITEVKGKGRMFGCSVEKVWSNAKWKEKSTGNENLGREKLKLCAGSCLDDKRKETTTQWTLSSLS